MMLKKRDFSISFCVQGLKLIYWEWQTKLSTIFGMTLRILIDLYIWKVSPISAGIDIFFRSSGRCYYVKNYKTKKTGRANVWNIGMNRLIITLDIFIASLRCCWSFTVLQKSSSALFRLSCHCLINYSAWFVRNTYMLY